MLADAEVFLNTPFEPGKIPAKKIIYTGSIDEYFDYKLGHLEYRSLRFETELLKDKQNYQGSAVVNYTSHDVPYTRVVEHKHFAFGNQKDTIITREYPDSWEPGKERFYPINDDKNNALYEKYKKLADKSGVVFAGRLGNYKYSDMDKAIFSAFELFDSLV